MAGASGASRQGSATLEEGVEFLWNKNKVEFLHGEASLAGGGKVKVGDDEHQAKAIILATGSVASPIPGIDFSTRVIDTWGAYSPSQCRRRSWSPAPARPARRRLGVRAHGDRGDLVEMPASALGFGSMARVVERQFKKDGMER